jgi:hypothetical protein
MVKSGFLILFNHSQIIADDDEGRTFEELDGFVLELGLLEDEELAAMLELRFATEEELALMLELLWLEENVNELDDGS